MPVPRNCTLEASPDGKVLLTWTHPRDPREFARYDLTAGSNPTLALYHNGAAILQVAADQSNLEIRLQPGSRYPCTACRVEVQPSTGADREAVTLSAGAGDLRGTFQRELSAASVPGDGRLQHQASDSIILLYLDPANPQSVVLRKSHPFIPPPGSLEVKWHNSIANAGEVPAHAADAWILSSPQRLNVLPIPGSTACCCWITGPLSRDDSLRYAGIQVAASDPFSLEMQVFTNFGQFVSKVGFAIPQSEFDKLPNGPGDTTRVLTLLWGNHSGDGRLAGTGAYVVRSRVSLIDSQRGWSGKLTWGVLRSRNLP
ncbi:MAG: hypothetical protein M3Y08_02750 [Fibrobacterota bacterium]|nr:hypothetical protein [Fibrobacterota bacterium]